MKINERNLCTFACTDPVDLNGFLNKRGEVNKAWQRRWFVLKGNLLFYFEKRGDKEPLGVIILEGCTIELAEDGEQYCFKIIFHGEKDRSYLLAAETQDLMEKWMKALTCAGYEYMKLMVAELQRQLEELEESQGKVAQENGQVTGSRTGGSGAVVDGYTPDQHPKAPPRRHNPFNRPQGAGGGEGLVNGGNGGRGGEGAADEVTIRQKDYSIQRQEPTTVTLLGAGASSSAAGRGAAAPAAGLTKDTPTTTDDNNEERFSFGSMHKALGQSFVQDRLKRRQEQEEQLIRDKSPGSLDQITTINTTIINEPSRAAPPPPEMAHSLGNDHRTAIVVESLLESHF